MSTKQYQTLANKYRPSSFTDLIGQDVLVRTLSNAIKSGRLANAYVLTGIRGVGKTTTARIIAKAFNCSGEDGKSSATIDPCGKCSNCVAISEDRHIDIIEVDAASHTSVDNAREIIENSRYLPVIARYKIYIIDEVHMLSKNAFNALLKTLEEPPAHVKFIFATTEIRKIPITVLSRCQRFDLKRIESEELAQHLQKISLKEDVKIDYNALEVIANIAEGSVRDALSLLDQAIVQTDTATNQSITEQIVRDMLGLADFTNIAKLFTLIAGGKPIESLLLTHELYQAGCDEVRIIYDLLDFTSLITKLKIAADLKLHIHYSEHVITQAKDLAARLEMSFLTRCWQMLLKALEEIKLAPDGIMALEMILIRIIYMANLPSPLKIIENLENNQENNNLGSNSQNNSFNIQNNNTTLSNAALSNLMQNNINPSSNILITNNENNNINENIRSISEIDSAINESDKSISKINKSINESDELNNVINTIIAENTISSNSNNTSSNAHSPTNNSQIDKKNFQYNNPSNNINHNQIAINSYEQLVNLFKQKGEILLHSWLVNDIKLISFSEGKIEINPSASVPTDFMIKVSKFLYEWTAKKWEIVTNKNAEGVALVDKKKQEEQKIISDIEKEEGVTQILHSFPGAKITQVDDSYAINA